MSRLWPAVAPAANLVDHHQFIPVAASLPQSKSTAQTKSRAASSRGHPLLEGATTRELDPAKLIRRHDRAGRSLTKLHHRTSVASSFDLSPPATAAGTVAVPSILDLTPRNLHCLFDLRARLPESSADPSKLEPTLPVPTPPPVHPSRRCYAQIRRATPNCASTSALVRSGPPSSTATVPAFDCL